MKVTYTTVTSPARARAQVRSAVAPVLLSGAYRVAADWQENIPHKWPGQNGTVTGNTARDIRVKQENLTRVSISTGTVSGKSLETGAKAHTIRPKRFHLKSRRGRGPAVLAWPAERGGAGEPGKLRIRGAARHPGVSARYYGRAALDRVKASLQAELTAAIARLS